MKTVVVFVVFLKVIFGAEEHAYQQFIQCSFSSEGQRDYLWNYGYDGKDIMYVDLMKETVVATSEHGRSLAEERKSTEYIKRKEDRLKMVCSAVQTVFRMSNSSLSKAVKPAVYLSSGGQKDEEYLKCVAQGFYPNVIRVQWTQTGRRIYYGVSTAGVLPHKDGRFQISSYLSLANRSADGVTCEIEHLSIDGVLKINFEEKSVFLSALTEPVPLAMASFLLGFVFSVCLTLIISWVRQHTGKPSEDETNDTADNSETSVNLMNVPEET